MGKTGVRWEQKVWFWIDTDDGISSKAPEWMLLAPLGVSLARESPSCCDWAARNTRFSASNSSARSVQAVLRRERNL